MRGNMPKQKGKEGGKKNPKKTYAGNVEPMLTEPQSDFRLFSQISSNVALESSRGQA